MRSKRKTGWLLLAIFASAVIAELHFEAGVLVGTAEAVVGRPLTPISYAGVARRTTRRNIAYATPGGVW